MHLLRFTSSAGTAAAEMRSYLMSHPSQAHLHDHSQKPIKSTALLAIYNNSRIATVVLLHSRRFLGRTSSVRSCQYDSCILLFSRLHSNAKMHLTVSMITLLFLLVFVNYTLALPPIPPRTPSASLVFAEADQQCGKVSCPNPYHAGAAFCRNLNQGCLFCGPNPRSIRPFFTFACVGHWQVGRPFEEHGVLNGSANRSAAENAFEVEVAAR